MNGNGDNFIGGRIVQGDKIVNALAESLKMSGLPVVPPFIIYAVGESMEAGDSAILNDDGVLVKYKLEQAK